MKAICLVLCIALARQSAGHIFRRDRRPMDGLIVEPREYIDQQELYQQQLNERYLQSDSQPRVYSEYAQAQRVVEDQRNEPKKSQSYKTASRYTHDSTSSESNSNERQNIQYFAPRAGDVKELNGRLSIRKQQEDVMKPAYGEAISWKGVKIASGPTTPVTKEDIEKIFNDAYETMSHDTENNKRIFHQSYEAAAKTNNEDAYLNATQLLNKYQYPVEEYTIKTDDGYFLTLFRIASKQWTSVPEAAQPKPVVFLMHGLLGSADDWLMMGPGKSLAYLLADAGYDVWLGNARGSKYSRRHVSKHPAQSDFWQYSNDEIALHDLPAMIDYALKQSNQQKLYYVGHTSGTTQYFALTSTRPEYNDKIIMMFALSPMAYMSNVRSPLFRMIAPNSQFYERLHDQLGHGKFMPSKELVNTLGGAMFENEIGCKNLSSNVKFVMSGVNVENLDLDVIPVIMKHLPAGGSTRQIKQYAQGVASHEFTKYDFGSEINEKVYGTRQPPKYEMEKVQAPVALYYSEYDWLAHPSDVERLANELPNVKDSYKVPKTRFSNMDFQFSKDAPLVVYKRLIKSINQYSQQNYVY